MSPSSLKSKAICPGFMNDPSGDKTAADRGTLGHKAVETDNPDLAGEDLQLRSAVVRCMDYKNALLHEMRVRFGEVSVYQEIKMYYFDQWGHSDLLYIAGPFAALIDWKFAFNEYEADAPQFWAYCLGIWKKYPNVEEIVVHVGLPFLGYTDIEVFTRKRHFIDFSIRIKAIIAAQTLNDAAHFRITEQCAFCGFAGKCRKLAEYGLEIGRRYAPELGIPDHPTLHGSAITDPQVIADLLRLARPMKAAAEGWGKAAMSMYDNGIIIPGHRLMSKKGNRQISGTKKAFDVIKQHFDTELTIEQFLDMCDISATALDALVEAKAPERGKAAAKRLLAAHLEDEGVLDEGGSGRFFKPVKGDS